MTFRNVREFIGFLETENELQRVAVEVDPKYEIGAICRKSLDMVGPALFFERIKDHSIPVVTNLLATRKRYCMALDTTPEKLHGVWKDRMSRSIDPGFSLRHHVITNRYHTWLRSCNSTGWGWR